MPELPVANAVVGSGDDPPAEDIPGLSSSRNNEPTRQAVDDHGLSRELVHSGSKITVPRPRDRR
jgi:hypothetical protein